jgi:hypothetical protein
MRGRSTVGVMAHDDPTTLEARLTSAIAEAARHALEDAQARHEAAWAAAHGAGPTRRASGDGSQAPDVSVRPDDALAAAWSRASYFAQLGVTRTADPAQVAAAHAARSAALRVTGAPSAWRRELDRAAAALADPGLAAAYAATAPEDDPATLAALTRAWPPPNR